MEESGIALLLVSILVTTALFLSSTENSLTGHAAGKPAAQYATLSVKSSPSGASVFVDSRPRGTTPLLITDLIPASHSVRVTKTGYNDFITTVSLAARKSRELSVTLKPSALKPSPPPALPFCGNGICEKNNNENSATCPEDCKADPQQKCVDSEKYTKDPFDTGTVTIYKGNKAVATYKEKCNPDGSLIEYYCIGNEKTEATMYCGPGYQCSNGACRKSPAPATARIQVTSDPSNAAVYIDEQLKGSTPATISGLRPGTYFVVVRKEGYYDFGKLVTLLDAGRTTALHAKLLKKPSPSPALPKPTGTGCGNGICEPPKEDLSNCPQDCKRTDEAIRSFCGNGVCDYGENYLKCPQDCKRPR